MQTQSKIAEPEPPQLPFWIEAAVVGGLVLAVYGPAMTYAVLDKMRWVRPGLKKIYVSSKCQIARRIEPLMALNRKRKKGSIIRVVASLLPDRFFGPPGRIYIVPNSMNLREEMLRAEVLYGTENSVLAMAVREEATNCTRNDEEVILAFELDTESSYGEVDEDVDDEVSSNPEIIDFTLPDLLPGDRPRAVACSTPQPLELPSKRQLDDESISTQGDNHEVEDLKKMVQNMFSELTKLRQSHDETVATLLRQSVIEQQMRTTMLVNVSSTTMIPPPPPMPGCIPVIKPVLSQVGGPPPPPPPPPPMPAMPVLGSQPLILPKKGQNNTLAEKKDFQPSMSDVLKGLPNAKMNLRRIARSPGGTPVKQNVPTIAMELKDVLRKRFADMHVSDDSDDEENTFKENHDFNDSFETRTTPKRNLFASPRNSIKRNSRKSVESNASAPFGQHLLKKSNQSPTVFSSSKRESTNGSQALRQRNQ